MKNLILICIIMLSASAFGQQKKTKKPPPITRTEILPPPETKKIDEQNIDKTKKCFVYKMEEQKDSVVYVTENLLEYGWAADNARLVITTYNYVPAKKDMNKKEGNIYAQSQRLRYIEGTYTIQKGILGFIPDKAQNYQNRTFKIDYKPKTQKVQSLQDESNHRYTKGGCPEPTISL